MRGDRVLVIVAVGLAAVLATSAFSILVGVGTMAVLPNTVARDLRAHFAQ